MEYFTGREDEQERFRGMLLQLSAKDVPGPDEGFVALAHGHGGLGKTRLLERFREIAAGEPPADRANRDRFVVAALDWEQEQRLHQADFAPLAGPPVWQILARLYRALSDDAPLSPRLRKTAERAFGPFRQQMTRLPELTDRARQLGLDTIAGRTKLSAEELAQIFSAAARVGTSIAGGVGALGPSAARAVPASDLGVLGAAAVARAQAYRHGAVDTEVFASLVSAVDALVHAFARGLRSFSRKGRPVVLILDTCELLGDASDWLLEVIRLAGSRTGWVLGARLAPQDEAAPDGALARLYTVAHGDRMIPLPLGPFDRRETAAYLSSIDDRCLPDGVTAAEILRVTRGIPLAISLIAPALREGRSPEELLSPSPDGTPSQLFRGLVLRYLKHIRASPNNADDLLLVYGLALSAHELADPRLLSALWDVPAAEVSGLLDRLAERHDFVLGASRRLHRDVGDAIRMYLLDPVELETVRSMNERAVSHLQERLTRRGPHGLEDQLSDDDWQHDTLSLLWHTYWVDPREGHHQLCHLFPAAAVLDPAFALYLTQVARYFASRCTGPERKVINGLEFLAARPFLPRQPEAAPDHGSAANPDVAAAVGALPTHSGTARHIPGNGVSPHVLVDMLVTMHGDAAGISMDERLTRLEEGARRVPPGAGRTREAATALARRMAGWAANLYVRENPLVDEQCALRAARIAVSLNPDDAASHAILGMLLAQLGPHPEAETELRRANQLDPAQGDLMLGVVLQASGQYEESAAILREAARRHRDSALVHKWLGGSLLACGKAAEAVPALRKSIRLDPVDGEAHRLLGQALLMRGRSGAGEASLRTALDIARDARTLALLGAALGQSGRLDEAEKLCREAVALDPSDAQAHLHLGTVLGEADRHAEAEASFRDAIRLAPEISEAHHNLGTALTAQSRHAEAAGAFQEAQRLDALRQEASAPPSRDPTGVPAPEAAASTGSGTAFQSASGGSKAIRDLFAEGRINEVADKLYKELQAFPDSAEVHSLLGGVLTMMGRFREAEGILREATDLNPHDANSYAHLGTSLLRMRRFDEAAAAARYAAELAPENLGVVGTAGFLLGETGYDEESVALDRRAIQMSPASAELHMSLAFGLRQLGRFEEAKQALSAALLLNDHDSGAHTNLGEVHLFTGDHDAARQSLRRAVELAPHTTMKARVLLGLLQSAHDSDAARSQFRAALRTTDPYQSGFAASEMSAIALTALGDTETAIHVLDIARSQRTPSDTYRRPLYDLLQQPPLTGAKSLREMWQEIVTADPRVARPFGENR